MTIKLELDNDKHLEYTDVTEYSITDKFFVVQKKGLTFFIKVDTIINAQVEYK